MKRWMLLCLCFLLLCACRSEREPEELSLVRVLGVDGSGPVELIAVGEEDRGRASGEDFHVAREKLPWSGERKLSLTSVSFLVVGPDAELESLLTAIIEDAELGALATVWLAPEGAAALLEGCDDPVARLDLLSRKGTAAPTAASALAQIKTDGEVYLPCLERLGEQMTERGRATWMRGD